MTNNPAPVRVLLDATALPPDRGGVGRYVEGLVSAADRQMTIVAQPSDVGRLSALAPHATVVASPAWARSRPLRLLWEQTGLPRLAGRLGVRAVHSPHYTIPLLCRLPRIVTFHDGTFFSDPSAHSRLKRWFFRAWIRIASSLADAVLVPSRATGEELEARVPALTDRWTVAELGVDVAVFHPPTLDEIDDFRRRHGLGDSWIAFLGTLEPRKNVPALLAAHRALWDEDRGDVPPLALAGGDGWDAGLPDALRAAPSGSVARLGYLPVDELRALLGGATIVTYPSTGEGFGLPVLEAMACGAAVLTTRRLAIPEVGGDAVAYSETDPGSLASALRDLLRKPDTRRSLGEAGRLRAAGFTWRRCWEIHERTYSLVVTSRRARG